MRINDANLDDSGTYRIKVENPIGKDEAEAQLLVGHTAVLDETPNIHPEDFIKIKEKPSPDLANEKPKFIIPLDDIKINEGDDLIFLCKVDGYPKPKVFPSN